MNGLELLLRKSWRTGGNFRRIMREQSVFKMIVVIIFGCILLFGLGALFHSGFHFLYRLGGAGLMVIHRMFSLFFFGLAVMLMFSSIVTSYATMYRSDEVPYLLMRPFHTGEIVLYKFLESALLSSWAFFFMIVPFIGAYAIHEKLSPLFSLWTIVFCVPFVILCSAIGSLLCMAIVRWLPVGRVLKGMVALAVLVGGWMIWRAVTLPRLASDDGTLILTQLVPGMKMASNELLPSWWVAEGMMALSRGDWFRGFMLLGVLVSTTLVAALVLEAVGQRIFYDGWQRGIASQSRARYSSTTMRWFKGLLGFTHSDVRGLLVKDVRLFLRDPMQWSQMLVFFGLLAIYFMNLRNLHYNLLGPAWRNLIIFLNLFSVCAVVCSISSRFVYPQMSLEGQSFWVIGLSPLTMGRVLRAKCALSCAVLTAVSGGLMLLSTHMLQVDPLTRTVSVVLAVGTAIAASCMSAGLGAMFLDLRQRNPAAIVSSFGGTLNLVVTMIYMLAVVVPVGMLFHMKALKGGLSAEVFWRAFVVVAVIEVVLLFLASVLPLWLGRKSLEAREY
jgi:ABC-2 type transport system permease protein